ncbi:hypothetical protein SLA2020_000550 [Shorea laevis]
MLMGCWVRWHKYAARDESDEKTHSTFHKNYTQRIQLKGWLNEKVIHVPNGEGVVLFWCQISDPVARRNKVQDVVNMMEIELWEGWIFHKFCKIYLFVSSQMVVGYLLAEPIKEAFRVLSCLSNQGHSQQQKKRHCHPILLDAMRKSFCTSFVLSKSQLAFSQPTSAGKALAFNCTDTKSLLVYKDST